MTQGGDRGTDGTAAGGRAPNASGAARATGSGAEGAPGAAEVDWPALRALAREAMSRAYAPYSGFPVGAAARVDDGRAVSGCNVENASYGLGLCAECGLVSDLLRSGGGTLTHFTCVDRAGEILMPCGRCRQLLYEFGGPTLILETSKGFSTLGELLPDAFGPDHLR